jgi:hypothetical protein
MIGARVCRAAAPARSPCALSPHSSRPAAQYLRAGYTPRRASPATAASARKSRRSEDEEPEGPSGMPERLSGLINWWQEEATPSQRSYTVAAAIAALLLLPRALVLAFVGVERLFVGLLLEIEELIVALTLKTIAAVGGARTTRTTACCHCCRAAAPPGPWSLSPAGPPQQLHPSASRQGHMLLVMPIRPPPLPRRPLTSCPVPLLPCRLASSSSWPCWPQACTFSSSKSGGPSDAEGSQRGGAVLCRTRAFQGRHGNDDQAGPAAQGPCAPRRRPSQQRRAVATWRAGREIAGGLPRKGHTCGAGVIL